MKNTERCKRLLLLMIIAVSCIHPFAGNAQTTYSIFQSPTVTASKNNDATGLEFGLKFQVSQAGKINKIRYYKATGTTGTHTGHIWTSAGSLMGSVTFTGETSSGWQEITFSTPVSVAASTVYVASVFSPSGDYCFTSSGLGTEVVNGPIKALANGVSGVNGVYVYTNSSIFPTNA